MTVTVHSNGKWITLEREGADILKHEVPRKNKFFKEELRLYKDEIIAWLCGNECDDLVVYKPHKMSFYRHGLYQAIVKATHRKDGLVLITTYSENLPVIR